MALLSILVAPDPRLKQKSQPVQDIDATIRRLIDDMFETMYDAPGIGLAAPQVGVLQRVIVVDCAPDGKRQPIALVNPAITWASDENRPHEEGCLSVPEYYAEVVRSHTIRISYRDRDGQPCELDASGLRAVVLQHEIDHLDGILFIDKLSALKRNMILRKLQKLRRLG